MWKNIGQYTYIRAMTCQGTHLIIYLVFFRGPERQEIPKHLTNFNHCMMTINSRGLAGGRGGGYSEQLLAWTRFIVHIFLEQFHIGFHDRFLARIHMYHHVLAYYIHIKPHIEHQWMLIRTRAWKKFEAILKIAANKTDNDHHIPTYCTLKLHPDKSYPDHFCATFKKKPSLG